MQQMKSSLCILFPVDLTNKLRLNLIKHCLRRYGFADTLLAVVIKPDFPLNRFKSAAHRLGSNSENTSSGAELGCCLKTDASNLIHLDEGRAPYSVKPWEPN